MTYYPFDSRRCFKCRFRRDEYRHLRACVPKRYWPPESEWRDSQPVVERVPAMVGRYPRAVYEQAFATVLGGGYVSHAAAWELVSETRVPRMVDEPVVDNQTVYLDDEPVAVEVNEVWPTATWDIAGPIGRSDVPEPAPKSGLACEVCGKVVKHAGAMSGHKRTHREVTA